MTDKEVDLENALMQCVEFLEELPSPPVDIIAKAYRAMGYSDW